MLGENVMKKLVALVLISSLAYGWGFGGDSDRQAMLDVIQQKAQRSEFLAKESINEVQELKNAINNINRQLQKQNKINFAIVEKLREIEQGVQSLNKNTINNTPITNNQLPEANMHEVNKKKQQHIQIKPDTYGVTIKGTWLDRKPNTNDNIIYLSRGIKLHIIGFKKDYYKVSFNGSKFYVNKENIEILHH